MEKNTRKCDGKGLETKIYISREDGNDCLRRRVCPHHVWLKEGIMREQIETTRLQRLRNTDPIFFDHVIEAIKEEIEKKFRDIEAIPCGFEGMKQKILKALEV